MRPFFSIIVCLYNVERFFEQAWKCLSEQSFADYEVILVDDGSTDRTNALFRDIIKWDRRYKLIKQENQGLGIARNTGIENAHGAYLCFYDVDDEVNQDWLLNLYSEINESMPDLVIYGYNEVNMLHNSCQSYRFERKYLKNKKEITDVFTEVLSGIVFNNGFVWNKIYNRNFIENNRIRFTRDAIQQDEIFNHRVYEKAQKIFLSDKILYEYHVYNVGNNRNRFVADRMGVYVNVKNSFIALKHKLGINDGKLDYYIHRRFLNSVLFNRNPKMTMKERRDFFKGIIDSKEVNDSVLYLTQNQKKCTDLNERFLNLYLGSIRTKSTALLCFVDYTNRHVRGVRKSIINWVNMFRNVAV